MRHVTPLLLLLACAPAVSAQSPTPAALVAQLGDPHFPAREAAGKKLLELGERALPALEVGLSSDVPEIARRCEDLLPALRQQVDAEAILTPTMVDLPDGETTVGKVFDSLSKQSRYTVRVEGDQTILSQKLTMTVRKATFWEAVQSVGAVAKLDVNAVDDRGFSSDRDRPPPVGTVWLKAAVADPPKRVTAHKALLIQMSSLTKDELALHPLDRSPLAVRVFPEPKVKWHRLHEVEMVKASDKSGQPFAPAPTPSALASRHAALRGWDDLDRKEPEPTSGLNERSTRGFLHLAAGRGELASLSATARFTAWKESGELAKVTFADKTGTVDGPCGTRLSATLVGPISNEPGSTTVEVKVRWDAERVRLEQSAAADAVWFENVNGRKVPVKAAVAKGAGTSEHGIRITNAAGEPLALTSRVIRFDTVRENGRAYTEFSVKYVAKAGKLADGTPAAVSFHAARVVEVVLPFAAKDLPLTAGTRAPDVRLRWKR